MTPEALGPWFHNLHLPDGTQTRPDHPLGDFPSFKWREIGAALPEDLRGATALDIGCNAGFYSFELARRGAEVLAIDIDDRYLTQARWACAAYGLDNRITFRRRSVYALQTLDRTFDLVLFLGVLYHLRHPLLALDIVARKVGGALVLQTLSLPGEATTDARHDPGLDGRDVLSDPAWPRLAFVEGRLAEDPSNWWVPNHACVEAMVRSCGLEVTGRPGHEIYLCTPRPTDDPVLGRLAAIELASVRDTW